MIYGQFLVGVDGGTVARTSGEFTYDTLSQFLTKSTADKLYLNENGDEMGGDIKMNNFKKILQMRRMWLQKVMLINLLNKHRQNCLVTHGQPDQANEIHLIKIDYHLNLTISKLLVKQDYKNQ